MIATSVKFKGYRCFKDDWAGFDRIKPINVIIGKNNAGKSCLLDLLNSLTSPKPEGQPWQLRCEGVLDEKALRVSFSPNNSDGVLGGNHWHHHGKHFLGQTVTWEINGPASVSNVRLKDPRIIATDLATRPNLQAVLDARGAGLANACTVAKLPIAGMRLLRLHAERDILPEIQTPGKELMGNGTGATNIVRRYLLDSGTLSQRDLIRKDLLGALNDIFRSDGVFTEINIQQNDGTSGPEGSWEVLLTEGKKGPIPLNQSGSGLKTILLVLLNLLVMPISLETAKGKCVFAFEELENNIHPSLLRRLFRFIQEYVVHENSTLFLTTHSSIALDVFGPSKDAQIIHVSHDGVSAKTATIAGYFDKQSVISELGAKPSDLLQANGVIWVEGPSDRIYINRWIELVSEETLREGRDYQCAFFGGSLLADEQFVDPDTAKTDLANLLSVNPNVIVICDGDRTAEIGEGAELKPRVARIQKEIKENSSGYVWATAAKEIENYMPSVAIQKVYPTASEEPNKLECFFPSDLAGERGSFWERAIKKRSYDKVELASKIARYMVKEDMEHRFDWKPQMEEIVRRIRHWNA